MGWSWVGAMPECRPADPTIAFGTGDGIYGAQATSLHCFMNQTASLLEEELERRGGSTVTAFYGNPRTVTATASVRF